MANAESLSNGIGKLAISEAEYFSETCGLIVMGMAGSGKTTFCKRLISSLNINKTPPYVLNLDPAVFEVGYDPHIDIRKSVDFKKVMEKYNLGPNGAIVSSLNLFATKFDQVLKILSDRSRDYKYFLIDTPGQIEVFTWSASGTIITDALASQFPTVVAFVIDVERSQNPITFMSNMLYACSIMYKTRLPMIVVLNKNDLCDSKFALEWIRDFEKFNEALDQASSISSSYSHSLARSLSLSLEEFYQNLTCVSVSSVTGEGFDEFISQIQISKQEYEQFYRVEYEKRVKRLRENSVERSVDENTSIHPDGQIINFSADLSSSSDSEGE